MKAAPLALALLLAACTSPRPEPIPLPPAPWHPTVWRFLPGIRLVESGGNRLARGDDGRSLGPYQLDEKHHEERARLYGDYDATDESQAWRVASGILTDNYLALGRASGVCDPSTWEERREDLAIASYRQGLRGVREHGAAYWYVLRVREACRENKN